MKWFKGPLGISWLQLCESIHYSTMSKCSSWVLLSTSTFSDVSSTQATNRISVFQGQESRDVTNSHQRPNRPVFRKIYSVPSKSTTRDLPTLGTPHHIGTPEEGAQEAALVERLGLLQGRNDLAKSAVSGLFVPKESACCFYLTNPSNHMIFIHDHIQSVSALI